MVKTATFESLLEEARPDGEDGFIFTLEGRTYRIKDRDEVRKIAEQHGVYHYLLRLMKPDKLCATWPDTLLVYDIAKITA